MTTTMTTPPFWSSSTKNSQCRNNLDDNHCHLFVTRKVVNETIAQAQSACSESPAEEKKAQRCRFFKLWVQWRVDPKVRTETSRLKLLFFSLLLLLPKPREEFWVGPCLIQTSSLIWSLTASSGKNMARNLGWSLLVRHLRAGARFFFFPLKPEIHF